MPGQPDRELVPGDVSGQIEALVAGDGPYAEFEENILLATEELGVGDKSPGEVESDRDTEIAGLQAQVSTLADLVSALSPAFREPVLIDGAQEGFWAKITGDDSDLGDVHQWKYSWTEVEKTSGGYGGWATLSGGRSGTTSVGPAYNSIEDMNTNVGGVVEGNGVDPENLGGDNYTFLYMPCTANNIVRMYEVLLNDTVEYWFSYENGIDGTCDAEE